MLSFLTSIKRLTLTLGRGGLYPLALFIPRSNWHFLSLEDFISGINYHGNVSSPDTFQHLGGLAFFIPGTFYPWKNLSPQTHSIFYPRNILSQEHFITGILYHWKNLSREESIPGRILLKKRQDQLSYTLHLYCLFMVNVTSCVIYHDQTTFDQRAIINDLK